jgi:VIT1/CCC1 family predicted Fe2+/Mn2+ transporter
MDFHMQSAWRTGLAFGMTSGVITTLGLIVGLHSGTHSRLAVIGGIATIAVADALSDALGIHITEEARARHDTAHVWMATFATFLTKFLMTLTFLVPVLVLELNAAIIASVVWGVLVLSLLSYLIARQQAVAPWRIIGEHVAIALVVIMITYNLGVWVANHFQ